MIKKIENMPVDYKTFGSVGKIKLRTETRVMHTFFT